MKRSRRLSTTLMLLAATALAGGAIASAPALATGGFQNFGPTVVTQDGPVRGTIKNGVNAFLGVPYAAPPVGALRWRPPVPAGRHGLLDASEYASSCPQVTELGAFAGPSSTNEDCLYLNVFTATTRAPLKPVLVWIHGGGNIDGETADYDGSKLATGGLLGTPIVVVTVNYRLGLFGFLSESHLNAEGHPWGNYGILDQQAALRWVRANIAAFGGDPNNVTFGGQSAGAIDTTAQLLSPAAAGLFQRAITQSAPIPNGFFQTAPVALSQGNTFAAAANCSSSACLRSLSTARVLQLQGTPNASAPYANGLPVVDGTIVPVLPETGWTTGAYHHMPILGGTTKDEGTFGLAITEYFSGPPQVALTAAQYNTNNSPAVLAEYPLGNYGNNPTLAQDRVGSDLFLKCPALRVLNQQAGTNTGFGVYGYDFTYQHAPVLLPADAESFRSDGSLSGSRVPHGRHSVRVPQVAWRESGREFGPGQRPTTRTAGGRAWPV